MRGRGCSSTGAAEPHEVLFEADCLKSVPVAPQPCLQAITGHQHSDSCMACHVDSVSRRLLGCLRNLRCPWYDVGSLSGEVILRFQTLILSKQNHVLRLGFEAVYAAGDCRALSGAGSVAGGG